MPQNRDQGIGLNGSVKTNRCRGHQGGKKCLYDEYINYHTTRSYGLGYSQYLLYRAYIYREMHTHNSIKRARVFPISSISSIYIYCDVRTHNSIKRARVFPISSISSIYIYCDMHTHNSMSKVIIIYDIVRQPVEVTVIRVLHSLSCGRLWCCSCCVLCGVVRVVCLCV